jgi:hypothetical protein
LLLRGGDGASGYDPPMSNPTHGPRPNGARQSHVAVGNRQLTIGECAAIGRYMQPLYDARGHLRVPTWAILEYLDSLAVCMTCGYLPGEHRVLGDRKTCRHYTRDS